MKNLYSARIIRREDQAVGSEYIKQFCMFCGIYVREFILEYAEDMKDEQEVDCNIFLIEKGQKDYELFKYLPAKKEIYICISDQCDLSSETKRAIFGDKLKELLLSGIAESDDDIYEIYDVFVEHDMAYTNYISHLYLYQFDLENLEGINANKRAKKSQKQKYIEKYESCLKDLYKSGENFAGSVYKKFAYLNCGRKINRINRANKQLEFFNVEAIVREAHNLNIEEKQFSMGSVLAGLTGLTEYETERDAELYLHSAISQERGQKHSAFIYYCLGHYYESDRHDWAMGWEEYQKMGSVVTPYNYRYNFKCGCKEFREGHYERAWEIFENIYKTMKTRAQREWIQPLEMEYYYKCAKILNEIPSNQNVDGDFMHKIERPTEYQVYDILENCIKRSKFVEGFIGKQNRNQIQKYYIYKMEGHSIANILGY